MYWFYFEYNNFENHLTWIMKVFLCIIALLLFTMAKALINSPAHDFVTLDTVKDSDFAPLMSGDWTQRLPEDQRKYRDQILSKLHLSHHQHKLNQRLSHRLKLQQRYLWFLTRFIFLLLFFIINTILIITRRTLYDNYKKSFSTLLRLANGFRSLAVVVVVSLRVGTFG